MILADHCVFATTIHLLQRAGYAVTLLKDLTNPDAPDDEVLKLAAQRDLVLLTTDKDFGNILLYPPTKHQGIIVLKITAETEALVHRVFLPLLWDYNHEGLRHKLAVVNHNKYRLRNRDGQHRYRLGKIKVVSDD